MNLLKKIYGSFLYYLAKFLDLIFGGLIGLFDFAVGLVEGVKNLIFTLLYFGCVFFVLAPLLIPVLLHPVTILIFLVLMGFPLLGKGAVSYLKYLQYSVTEYLYDKAEYYKTGKETSSSFKDYQEAYKRLQEENRRRYYEERKRAEEEMFRQAFEDFFRQRGTYYGGYSQGQGQYTGGQYSSPLNDFVEKYEKAIQTLEVDQNADQYQIKLAYKKMAKKYHPDLNHDPGATEKFQEINAAFEFLTEENIKRYAQLKGNK